MPSSVLLVSPPCASTDAWTRVMSVLDRRAVSNRAFQLPSCIAESSDDDAQALRAALDGSEGPIVLVGHSSGGFVITEVGLHPVVRHLVYMDAILPEVGESITTFMGKLDPSFASTFRARRDIVWFDPDALMTHLTSRGWVPGEARQFAAALRPQRVRSTVVEATVAAWRQIPSTLIRAADSEMDREVQALCAGRATNVVDIPGDHFPNWRRPDDVARIVADVVRGLDR